MMKKKSIVEICAILAIAITIAAAGCLNAEQKEELKNSAHQAIIEYVETEGQEKAIEYIDQLVAEEKLGSANAEKLKEAIPQGIEKLKEVMGELEAEEEQGEQEEAENE